MKSLLPIASLCLLVTGFLPSLRAEEPRRAIKVQPAQVQVVQVLLPSAPLVVSVELLIDGRPLLEHREEVDG